MRRRVPVPTRALSCGRWGRSIPGAHGSPAVATLSRGEARVMRGRRRKVLGTAPGSERNATIGDEVIREMLFDYLEELDRDPPSSPPGTAPAATTSPTPGKSAEIAPERHARRMVSVPAPSPVWATSPRKRCRTTRGNLEIRRPVPVRCTFCSPAHAGQLPKGNVDALPLRT